MHTIQRTYRRLRQGVSALRRDERAATALIFGLACIPLLAIAGVALD